MTDLSYQVEKDRVVPELVIYDSRNYQSFYIWQLEHALDYLFSHKDPNQPLFLYIHGRALGGKDEGQYDNEPLESKNDVVPVFHEKYQAKILMLHWAHRSREAESEFPEDDARYASKALAAVIKALNSQAYNSTIYPGFRALVSHSMGSIVIEEAISKYSEDFDCSGFDVSAIYAAASRSQNSHQWLEKINSKQSYAIINTDDFVLEQVQKRKGFTPLGLSDQATVSPLASNTSYIEVKSIAGMFGERHNYFVAGKVSSTISSKILKGITPVGVSAGHYFVI